MRLFLTLAVLAHSVSCAKTGPQQRAEHAARAYDATHGLARSGDPERRVTVADNGAQWIVTRHVPVNYAGGEDIYFVDKRTMKVVEHLGTQ